MLLETKGDYEFADMLTGELHDIASALKELGQGKCLKQCGCAAAPAWDGIIRAMGSSGCGGRGRFSINDDGEILCRTNEDANCVADFLEAMGLGVMCASFDDPAGAEGRAFRYGVHPNGG